MAHRVTTPLRAIPCSPDVRETKGAPDTFFRTERFQALIDPVAAESAFLSAAIPGTEVDCVVGAGIAASLAPGAFLSVNQNDPVRPLVDSPLRRAGLQAGRILTVHACAKVPGEAEVGVATNGHIRGCAIVIEHLHPGTHFDAVFDLAGNHAGAAADASSCFKYQKT